MQTEYQTDGDSAAIACPYCGETITLSLDSPAGKTRYVEDCQVCCRPIELTVDATADGLCWIGVARDDD